MKGESHSALFNMSSSGDELQQARPRIAFTKSRGTTKTRNAATSARRRKNRSLCRAVGDGSAESHQDGSKDEHSWFARKAATWTDNEIKSHLTSGGATQGGKSLSFVGDSILGEQEAPGIRKIRKAKLSMFAWQDEEECDGGAGRMMAAPTVEDIMDERDKVELMAPVKTGSQYRDVGAGVDSSTNDDKQRKNSALSELAHISGVRFDGGSAPTSSNESIGWRLLRVWGYRARFGVAFVPMAGATSKRRDEELDCLEMADKVGTLQSKWLKQKRLRRIQLPSIKGTGEKSNLAIPPPKTNRHSMDFDAFKNAPEFRAFHERRRALAQRRGRAMEEDEPGKSTKYFTDNVRDERWGDANTTNGRGRNDPKSSSGGNDHSHYATERYRDFIGTKASSGFALDDADDTFEGDDQASSFPAGKGTRGDMSQYNLEIESPVASEDEQDDGNLFGRALVSNRGPAADNSSKSDADAWGAWGMGDSESTRTRTLTTMDGRTPLTGFVVVGRNSSDDVKSSESARKKRWRGPVVPSGYILKRHVFPAEVDDTLPPARKPSEAKKSAAKVPAVLPQLAKRSSKMLTKTGEELNFHEVKRSMQNRFVTSTGDSGEARQPENEQASIGPRNLDEEEWIDVTVSSFLPSRLLCKRWGVPVPTGASSSAGDAQTSKFKSSEDDFFRQTIYEPRLADRKQRGAAPGNEDLHFNLEGEKHEPPSRPSEDVFREIFDVESSDMEISDDEAESCSVLPPEPDLPNPFVDLHVDPPAQRDRSESSGESSSHEERRRRKKKKSKKKQKRRRR